MITFDEPHAIDRVPLIRLNALPAANVWRARRAVSLYAAEPRSIVTVALRLGGLLPGDTAGLAVSRHASARPFAWLGVERDGDAFAMAQFDEQGAGTSRVRFDFGRVWLSADCDFDANEVEFRFSSDGRSYATIGESRPIGDPSLGARGMPCSLFSCTTKARGEGGHADFDSFVVSTQHRLAGAAPGVAVADRLAVAPPSAWRRSDRSAARRVS